MGRSSRAGFNVVELVSVVGIVGVILAILLPSIAMSRRSAMRTSCENNLRQVGLSIYNYHGSFERFPMGFSAVEGPDPLLVAPGWGWQSTLLPFLEQSTMAGMIDFRASTDAAGFGTIFAAQVRTLMCPADGAAEVFTVSDEAGKPLALMAPTSYVGSYGAGGDPAADPSGGNGFFTRNRSLRMDEIQDGLSNTLMAGERSNRVVRTPWPGVVPRGVSRVNPAGPSKSLGVARGGAMILARIGETRLNSPDSGPLDFYGDHPDGVLFLNADGSVRFVRESVDLPVLRALATRDGGEILPRSRPHADR